MSVTLLAAGAAAGAASGAAGGLMGGKKSEQTQDYHPLQKPFVQASQAQIPLYMQMITGGMPAYMRRYLQQTQNLAQQQGRVGLQDYMRQIGRGGMDFGAAAQAGMAGIIGQGNQNALAQYTQVRNQMTQEALGRMQQWSQMAPGAKTTTEEKVPSAGRQAGAGALGGLGTALGSKKNPALGSRTPGRAAAPPPPSFRGPTTGQTAMQNTNVPNQMVGQATGLNKYLPNYGITNIPGGKR